jgi:hypothetical protein
MRVYGIIFSILAFCLATTPASALSDEARAILTKLKEKGIASQTVLAEQAPGSDKATEADKPVEFQLVKINVGTSKADVINILGKPIHDGTTYLKYGLNETIRLKDGRVVDWFR